MAPLHVLELELALQSLELKELELELLASQMPLLPKVSPRSSRALPRRDPRHRHPDAGSAAARPPWASAGRSLCGIAPSQLSLETSLGRLRHTAPPRRAHRSLFAPPPPPSPASCPSLLLHSPSSYVGDSPVPGCGRAQPLQPPQPPPPVAVGVRLLLLQLPAALAGTRRLRMGCGGCGVGRKDGRAEKRRRALGRLDAMPDESSCCCCSCCSCCSCSCRACSPSGLARGARRRPSGDSPRH